MYCIQLNCFTFVCNIHISDILLCGGVSDVVGCLTDINKMENGSF